MRLLGKLKAWERDLRLAGDYDLSDPAQRRRAMRNIHWFDHGILRYRWTNFHRIAPGVHRSNHPTDARFADYARMGIRTVINLRGAARHARYALEVESCARYGLVLVDAPLQARKAPTREMIRHLIACFRSAEKPVLMHCKSGADRAGLASAIWLMVMEGRPVAEAQAMLSTRFIHLRWSRTGVLDHLLDLYAADHAASGIGFETWIDTVYDHARVQASFDALPRWRR